MPNKITKSLLFEKAAKFFPPGLPGARAMLNKITTSLLFGKAAKVFPPGLTEQNPIISEIGRNYPPFLTRGRGATVWTPENVKYLDCGLAWGSIILGHSDPRISRAISRQCRKATTLGGTSPVSLDVAEIICDMIPSADTVRFGKNGSDATQAAVRIARSHTGRDKIACSGYHGFHDWYLAGWTYPLGVPKCLEQCVVRFELNNIASIRAAIEGCADEIAGIIIEPLQLALATPEFLSEARALADNIGAVLIYDEVMTAFRVSRGGIQEITGVTPDLVCLGKAIANGMPVSAVAGKRDIMAECGRIFFGMTFGDERVSLEAARTCLEAVRSDDVPAVLGEKGHFLRNEYSGIAEQVGISTEMVGPDQRLMPIFHETKEFGTVNEQHIRFIRHMYKQRIICTNIFFLSMAHDQRALDHIAKAFRVALESVAQKKD